MTLLIKNVHILGGKGKTSSERADIFISGDRISAIGSFPAKPADRTIDGQGAWASAGFIDVHSEADHYGTIFADRDQSEFLGQGITTMVVGQDGESLAPFSHNGTRPFAEWIPESGGHANWRSVVDFMAATHGKAWGVRFSSLIGYGSLRRLLGRGAKEVSRREDILSLQRMLDDALTGGMGLSLNPGSLSEREVGTKEVRAMMEVLAAHKLPLFLNLPGGDDAEKWVRNIRELRRKADTAVVFVDPDLARTGVQLLDEIGEMGCWAELPSFGGVPKPLYEILPGWSRKATLRETFDAVQDDWLWSRIAKDIPIFDPGEFWIVRTRGTHGLAGMTLARFMEAYEIARPSDALRKVMLLLRLEAVAIWRKWDERILLAALAHPRVLVGSRGNSADPASHRFRAARTLHATHSFPKFIGLAEAGGWLEDAVRRITEVPANLFGFRGFDRLGGGKYADITLFRGGEIATVVVGGGLAWHEGSPTRLRMGAFKTPARKK